MNQFDKEYNIDNKIELFCNAVPNLDELLVNNDNYYLWREDNTYY